MDVEFESGRDNMRGQVLRYLESRYPGAHVNADAPARDDTRAHALHFEIWASPLRHLRISSEACVVMKDVVNIGDELERIGAGDALDREPFDVAVLASDVGPGLRIGPG